MRNVNPAAFVIAALAVVGADTQRPAAAHAGVQFVPVGVHPIERDDPQFGTWVLDTAASTFSPGPQVASQTITFEYAGPTEIRVTSKGALVDGRSLDNGGQAQIVHVDGKTYQFTAAAGEIGTRTDRRLGPGQRVSERKMANGVVQTTRLTVLPDGETMAIDTTGRMSDGTPVENHELLQKVSARSTGGGGDDDAAVLQSIRELAEAGARGDAETYAALRTADSIFVSEFGRREDREAARRRTAARQPAKYAAEITDPIVRFYPDHVAIVTARLTRRHNDGRPGAPEWFTQVLVEQDGRWRTAARQATLIPQATAGSRNPR